MSITSKTIILSRTDSIGDVVLTLPVAGFLKESNPDIHIIFLGTTYTKPVVLKSRHVDEFWNWDELEARPLSEVIEKFSVADTIVHIFPRKEIASIASKAKIQNRIGTSHRLFHLTTCNHRPNFTRKHSNFHEAELNFFLLKPLGITSFPLHDELHKYYGIDKPSMPKGEWQKLVDPEKFNLILHPKSKGSAAEWPLSHFVELCELLPPTKFNLFVTGTADDGDKIGDAFKGLAHVQNTCGKLSLEELVAFIGNVNGLVSASTGPLHIAASLGIHAIGLYAPIRPIFPTRWMPLGLNAKTFCKPLEAGHVTIEDANYYLQAIAPQEVADYLLDAV